MTPQFKIHIPGFEELEMIYFSTLPEYSAVDVQAVVCLVPA